MITEGAFNNSHGSLINSLIIQDRTSAVITHEAAHYELGSTTTYGQLLIMLHKNIALDTRAQQLYGELFSHVYRMQERTAVNIELLSQFILNDKKAFLLAVESLQEKNRTYYNYFRKLCCINGQVHSKSDASTAISVIRAISKWAMNIDLDKIPFESFFTAKDVQQFFSTGTNNSKFNPNKRFDIIVNCFFRSTSNIADLEAVVQGTIPLDETSAFASIHQKAEIAASKVFETSPFKERLIRRIQTIGSKQIDMDREEAELLTILPVDFSNPANPPQFIKLDFESFAKQLNKQKHREIVVLHQFGGFEDFYLCTIRNNDGTPITYILPLMNKYTFLKALQDLKCRTIFMQSKIIVDLHKSLKRVVGELPIFICYDTPIINALDFLKTFYCGGQYYFQEKTGYLLLVVYKKSFFTIINVVNEARNLLEAKFANAGINPSSKPYYMDQIERINEDMRSGFQVQ